MPPQYERPLLTGGEQLKVAVERITGFGPKFHPWSVDEARTALRPQIAALEAVVEGLPDAMRGPRLVFQATMLPNYLAASYFPDRLLEQANIAVLGSRPARAPYRTAKATTGEERTSKALILGATSSSLAVLDRLAAEEHPTQQERRIQEGFQRLHEIRLASTGEVIRAPGDADLGLATELFEAVLHPEWDEESGAAVPAREEILGKWNQLVASLGGDVVERYRRTVGALTFVPIHLNRASVDRLAGFNPLRALRPMPKLRPIPPSPLRHVRRSAPDPPTDPNPTSDTRIAIFDGGWDASCPYTAPITTPYDLTPEPPDDECVVHGSAVTAAVLYGHVDSTSSLPSPAAVVDHYRVLPVPATEHDFDLNWVLDRIVETVQSGNHRVVNLSLGPDVSMDDGEPHRWTAELDRLALEHDVLFVTAVGNNGEADADAGLNRIQVPGDMANGLGVGACTDFGAGRPWARSPFSAVGPGRQGARVKPTGLAFGGDGNGRPFVGLGAAGRWYAGHGTSFSTPLVSRSVASIVPYSDASGPLVDFVRAMAVHFAEAAVPPLPVEEVGHGRFRPWLIDAASCEPDTVTVMYRDVIRRGEVLGLPIPMPDDIRRGRVGIRWTLAITAPVDPADATEYTLAGIELQFRPHARKIPFTSPDGSQTHVVDTQSAPGRVTDLLRLGFKPSDNPATRAGARIRASESSRRDEGKWETLVHVQDRLLAKSLFEPRLDLSYFARSGGMLRGDAHVRELPFTIIVTIDGPSGSGLYREVRTRYPILTPIGVTVRARVRT